jgi:hypothetical protein
VAELATAYVRIRAATHGFKQEAEAGIKTAGASLGKVFAIAFGVTAAAELGKSVVEAASHQQAAIARVEQIAKSAGAATEVYGKSIRENLVELAERSGFSVDDLAQAFGRIEQQTKNTTTTLTTLNTVTDVARARGQGLAQVATAITRAYAGNAQGLGRLGIILPKYTAGVDALKHAHDQAVASGIKFTKQQELDYRAQLVATKANDKLVGSQKALAEVSTRFRGQGSIFGETASGQVARFHVAIEELEVSVGNKLIPYLGAAAEAGRKWADELGQSESFAQLATDTINTLANAARGAGDVFRAIAPEIEFAVHAIQGIVGTVGAGPILATYAAYKTLGFILPIVTAAQRAFAVATGEAAVAAEAEKVAVAGLGTTLPILAGAAIVGGLFYLTTLTDAQTVAVNRLSDAYGNLKSASQGVVDAQRAVASAHLEVSSARTGREQAAVALRQARAQEAADLQDSTKNAGVREQDALRVAAAEDQWRQANQRVIDAERTLREDTEKTSKAVTARKDAVKKLTDEQVAQLALQSRAGIGARGANLSKNIDAEVASWRKLATQVDRTTAAQRFNLRNLADITEQTRKLPSYKEIVIALNDHQFFDAINRVRGALGAAGKLFSGIVTGSVNEARGAQAEAVKQPIPPGAVKTITTTVRDATAQGVADAGPSIAEQVAKSFKDGVTSAKQNVVSLGDTLGGQIGDVMDAALAASEAKLDASPAAQRVKELTAEVAAIQARRDARSAGAAIDTTAADLAKLQAAFGPGAHTAEQDAQLTAARNAALDAQDAAKQATLQGEADTAQKALDARKAQLEKMEAVEKDAAQRRIADQNDLLNRGLITSQTYISRVTAELRKEGVNYKSAGRLLGNAFATGFKETLDAELKQAKIIANLTPAQRGKTSGNAPQVIDPNKLAAETKRTAEEQKAAQASAAAASATADHTAATVDEIKKLGGIIEKHGDKFVTRVSPDLPKKRQENIVKLAKGLK